LIAVRAWLDQAETLLNQLSALIPKLKGPDARHEFPFVFKRIGAEVCLADRTIHERFVPIRSLLRVRIVQALLWKTGYHLDGYFSTTRRASNSVFQAEGNAKAHGYVCSSLKAFYIGHYRSMASYQILVVDLLLNLNLVNPSILDINALDR